MNKINYVFLNVFLFLSTMSFSQISTNSPYSRFGLGSLSGSVLAQHSALGGASAVHFNTNSINPENPATYSAFEPKSFLFSTALNSSINNFETSNQSQNESNTNFSHLAMGFPLNKYFKVSSGLLPYSSIGYNRII